MWTVLVWCGALLVAVAGLARWVGRPRSVPPLPAFVFGLALVGSGVMVRVAGLPSDVAPRALPAIHVAVAQPAPPAQGAANVPPCPRSAQNEPGPSDVAPPLPPKGAAEHAPIEIAGLPFAPAGLIRANGDPDYPRRSGEIRLNAASALATYDAVDYASANGFSDRTSLSVELGTLRPGFCPVAVVLAALYARSGGMVAWDVQFLKPGPALAGQGAVLACGSTSSQHLNRCVWASATGRRVVGALQVGYPDPPGAPADGNAAAALADQVFRAVTG